MAENEAVETAEEQLPEDVQASPYVPLEELDIIDGRYQCVIELKAQDEWEVNQPVGDLFLMFDKPLTLDAAKATIMNTSIKNGVLNILNSISGVKGFHTYSDYLVLLALVDGADKVKDQLEATFQFNMKGVSEEEYQAILAERTAANEAEAKAQESVDITEDQPTADTQADSE